MFNLYKASVLAITTIIFVIIGFFLMVCLFKFCWAHNFLQFPSLVPIFIEYFYRGELTEDNKLLTTDSEECQYLEAAMNHWTSSNNSGSTQPTDGNNKYQVLEDIVEREIPTRAYQQVSYFFALVGSFYTIC